MCTTTDTMNSQNNCLIRNEDCVMRNYSGGEIDVSFSSTKGHLTLAADILFSSLGATNQFEISIVNKKEGLHKRALQNLKINVLISNTYPNKNSHDYSIYVTFY